MKKENNTKELLQKQYLTPNELVEILRIPYKTALRYANDIRQEMKTQGYLIPDTRNKLVLTKLVKKKFGI